VNAAEWHETQPKGKQSGKQEKQLFASDIVDTIENSITVVTVTPSITYKKEKIKVIKRVT